MIMHAVETKNNSIDAISFFLFVIDDAIGFSFLRKETYVMQNYFFGSILQFVFIFSGGRFYNCALHK